jgi:anti-sigma-K factor RskA
MNLTPPLLDLLAREYALGTLHGAARRRFETIMRQRPEAARAVHAWATRLGRLAAAVPVAQPSPQLWQGVQRRLFGATAPAAKPAHWWQRAGFGLGGALAGAALAALLLVPRPTDDEALPASYVGLLADATGKPTVLASAKRQGRTLSIKLLQPVAVPPGRVARLWALPDDGSAPRLIGNVPASGKSVLSLNDRADAVFAKVSRLGVSVEPAPGGAAPGEPFVLSGACVKLW